MVVEFLKHETPYAEGDIAGIPDEQAEQYIKDRIAREYKSGKSEPASKEPEQPEEKSIDESPRDKQVKGAPVKK